MQCTLHLVGFQSTHTHINSYPTISYQSQSQLVPTTSSYPSHLVPNTNLYAGQLITKTNSYSCHSCVWDDIIIVRDGKVQVDMGMTWLAPIYTQWRSQAVGSNNLHNQLVLLLPSVSSPDPTPLIGIYYILLHDECSVTYNNVVSSLPKSRSLNHMTA